MDSDEAMSHLMLCPPTFLVMLTGNNSSFSCWDCGGISAPCHTLKPGISLQCKFIDITESQNIWVGKHFWRWSSPTPCSKQGQLQQFRTMSSWVLSISKDGHSSWGVFFMLNYKYLLHPLWLKVIISMDQQLNCSLNAWWKLELPPRSDSRRGKKQAERKGGTGEINDISFSWTVLFFIKFFRSCGQVSQDHSQPGGSRYHH